MRLQLLRSFQIIKLFTFFFVAFLISKKLHEGDYALFIFFLLFTSPLFWKIMDYTIFSINQWTVLNIFYAIIIIYFLFEKSIKNIKKNIFFNIDNKVKIATFLQKSTNLIYILITLIVFQIILNLNPIKNSLKYNLAIKDNVKQIEQKSFQDIVSYTNKNIDTGGNP